jgi:predicted dehydrogenase
MGRRHLREYRVLEDFEAGRLEVAAVVDPELKRAEFVAGEAEELFGVRPQAFKSLEEAVAGRPELDVVDIVAAPSVHHAIAEVAFEAGLHVLTEQLAQDIQQTESGKVTDRRRITDPDRHEAPRPLPSTLPA